jgi:hypothetical protein
MASPFETYPKESQKAIDDRRKAEALSKWQIILDDAIRRENFAKAKDAQEAMRKIRNY